MFSTYHLMQCTRSTSDSERKRTCNTFVADSSCALAILLLHNCLERVIDLHSHVMFTIRSRDMLQKHTKARKNNPASEPICKAWLQKYQWYQLIPSPWGGSANVCWHPALHKHLERNSCCRSNEFYNKQIPPPL